MGFWEKATDRDRKRPGRLEFMSAEDNKRTYARYIEILNAQYFYALPEVVDPRL
jgi:hypothetical protein